MDKKAFWKSKTFWVNLISIGGIVYQNKTGNVLPANTQVSILAVINIVLRLVTNEPIGWKDNKRNVIRR